MDVDFAELTGLIYEAALHAENWPLLLDRLANALGGTSAWLSQLDGRDASGTGLIAQINPQMVESLCFSLRAGCRMPSPETGSSMMLRCKERIGLTWVSSMPGTAWSSD